MTHNFSEWLFKFLFLIFQIGEAIVFIAVMFFLTALAVSHVIELGRHLL